MQNQGFVCFGRFPPPLAFIFLFQTFILYLMGQSLSARIEWSSQTFAAPDGSTANLMAKSLINEDLLHDLVQYVDYLAQHYPSESRIEFKKPLHYASGNLKPSMFANEKAFSVVPGVK